MKAKSLTEMTGDLRKLTGASAAADLFAGANGAGDGADQERMRAQASRLIAEALGAEVKRSLQEIGSAQRHTLQELSAQQREHLVHLIETVELGLATLRQERASLETAATEAAVAALERNLVPALERLLARQQLIRAAPIPPFPPRRSASSPLVMTLWGLSVVAAAVIGALLARLDAVLAVWHGLSQSF